MKIGIVVPVFNQFELALKAIASAKSKFDWQPYIQKNWIVNRGVSGAWNDGINQAFDDHCNYVLVINDDVVLSPFTIDSQIKVLNEKFEDGIVLTSGWHTLPPDNNDAYSMSEYPEMPDSSHWPPGADFACFMISPRCWHEVGEFDEKFYPAYFEDNDYHRRILMSGYKAITVVKAPYYHYGSRTQNSINVVNSEQFLKNKEYYVSKWGGEPGAEIYSIPFNDHAS